jgi:hypothetical protein
MVSWGVDFTSTVKLDWVRIYYAVRTARTHLTSSVVCLCFTLFCLVARLWSCFALFLFCSLSCYVCRALFFLLCIVLALSLFLSLFPLLLCSLPCLFFLYLPVYYSVLFCSRSVLLCFVRLVKNWIADHFVVVDDVRCNDAIVVVTKVRRVVGSKVTMRKPLQPGIVRSRGQMRSFMDDCRWQAVCAKTWLFWN